MKKIVVLALACVFMLGNTAFASTKNFIASVSFSGGTVSFNATLASGSNLTWDTSKVTLGSSTTQWLAATARINMTKTITKNTGYVYIYQDNKAEASGSGQSADYVATKGKTQSEGVFVYNGLVKGKSGGGEDGYLSMTYKITTTEESNPNLDPKDGTADRYGVRYFTDKGDTNFAKNGYTMVANSSGYIADVGEGGNPEPIEGSASVTNGYMYVGAGFVNVIGGDSYGSNHIVFETVGE